MAAVAEVVMFDSRNEPATIEAMADARLDTWAEWARDHVVKPWPSMTLLGRMIKQGPRGAAQQGRPPVTMPDEVAAVDKAVTQLSDLMRGVILAHYLTHAPSEVKAKSLHMSRAHFWRLLGRARRKVWSLLQ
jgi:hypothetical protein